MAEKINRPRGTRDILPAESRVYQYLEDVARENFERHGYAQLRTPTFEDVRLFSRSIGESTDIIQKEMYVFRDKKGREMALRPEGTAGIVRACVENNLIMESQVLKVYYAGSMFRYERPQAGRYREFYQIGAEYFGSAGPEADAEVIFLAMDILSGAGIENHKLFMNSLGCTACREIYRGRLIEALKRDAESLCEDCRTRLELNPLRILDCKVDREKAGNLPKIRDFLCGNCRDSFAQVEALVKAEGCNYEIDDRLVRGLDYYNGVIFEIKAGNLTGTEDTVAGGGRYDALVRQLGGRDTPACGFAIGVERVSAMIGSKFSGNPGKSGLVFVAVTDKKFGGEAFRLCRRLRSEKISVLGPFPDRSLKSQLRLANASGADFAVIEGEKELGSGSLIVRNMLDQTQKEVPAEKIVQVLKEGR